MELWDTQLGALLERLLIRAMLYQPADLCLNILNCTHFACAYLCLYVKRIPRIYRHIYIYIYPRRHCWSLTSTCRDTMFGQPNIEVVKSLDLWTFTFPIMLLLSHGPIGLKSQALPHSMKRALSKSQGLRIARCQVGIVIIIPYDPAPFFAYSPKESVNLAGSEVPPPPCHGVGQS
jgi:hypothetical protein